MSIFSTLGVTIHISIWIISIRNRNAWDVNKGIWKF